MIYSISMEFVRVMLFKVFLCEYEMVCRALPDVRPQTYNAQFGQSIFEFILPFSFSWWIEIYQKRWQISNYSRLVFLWLKAPNRADWRTCSHAHTYIYIYMCTYIMSILLAMENVCIIAARWHTLKWKIPFTSLACCYESICWTKYLCERQKCEWQKNENICIAFAKLGPTLIKAR